MQLFTGIGERFAAARHEPLAPFYQGAHVGMLLLVIVSLTVISLSWGTNEFIYFNF